MTSVYLQRASVSTARMSAKRKTKGFTLIEVLVVVAIIALLISILLPSLRRAREQTKRVVCATNQRTCHQAMLYYLQSNQDFFPFGTATQQLDPWEIFWKYVYKTLPSPFKYLDKIAAQGRPPVSPNTYLCAPDFYLCPSDQLYHTSSQAGPLTMPDGSTKNPWFALSYCIPLDMMFIRNPVPPGGLAGSRRASSIKRQSSMVLIGEYQDDSQTMRGGWMVEDSDSNQADHWQLQHLAGCSAVYLDGHVQFHSRLEPGPGQAAYGFQYGLPPYPAALNTNFERLVIPAGQTAQQAWEAKYGLTWGHTATVQRVP